MERKNYFVKAEGKGYVIYKEVGRAKSPRKLATKMRKMLMKDLVEGKNAIFDIEDRERRYQVLSNEKGERAAFDIINELGEVIATWEYYRDLYVEISEITRKDSEEGYKAVFEFKEDVK